MIYPGEHAAIVNPEVWDSVNAEFKNRERSKYHLAKERDSEALLGGRLFCGHCEKPMAATYSVRRGRRYRYYVCRNAVQKGWGVCPAKSVSASVIEESLVSQLRVRLSTEEMRRVLQLSNEDWKAFVHDPAGLIPALIESVCFTRVTGTVRVELRALGVPRQDSSCFEYKLWSRHNARLPAFGSGLFGEPPKGRAPRIARLLALAHKLETLVRSGAMRDSTRGYFPTMCRASRSFSVHQYSMSSIPGRIR